MFQIDKLISGDIIRDIIKPRGDIKMEKKQRLFRLTDAEYESLKDYLKKLRDGEQEEQPSVDNSEKANNQQATKEKPKDILLFLERAEKWYRSMKGLIEVGSIDKIPDVFRAGGQQFISPTGIVSVMGNSATELPVFVEDILNGGTYPNREDCTQEEAAILYDAKFKVLYKAFLVAKNDVARQNIKQSMIQLVGEILA